MPDQPNNSPLGPRLEVICGPMFSGKTTELIRRVEAARSAGSSVMVFKPASDARYATDAVVTHAGGSTPAIAVSAPSEIPSAASRAEFVAIDEAHFFGSPLVEVVVALLRQGRRVVVAGVERDHTGRPFEPFPALLCEADEVLKLSGPCTVCGRPAVHSQRIGEAPGRIVVGGAEMYEARCRECFEPAPDERSR
jgi:thymidine kinase